MGYSSIQTIEVKFVEAAGQPEDHSPAQF